MDQKRARPGGPPRLGGGRLGAATALGSGRLTSASRITLCTTSSMASSRLDGGSSVSISMAASRSFSPSHKRPSQGYIRATRNR